MTALFVVPRKVALSNSSPAGARSIQQKELSPREEQIIDLCSQGFTNEGIAHELGLSMGTINTYWLRIRTKVGGSGRAEIVSRVIKHRAEKALQDRRESGDGEPVDAQSLFDLRATMALLNLAMEGIQSTAWATDRNLVVRVVANGALSAKRSGVACEVGKSVYDAFKTDDPEDPGVRAHRLALRGRRCTVRLGGEDKMVLRVMPLRNERDEIMGCVSLLASLSRLLKG